MRILNFHDLGEGGDNACCEELDKLLPGSSIVSETHDLAGEDPDAILARSMLSGPYDLVVGTGFGGVFALLFGRATGVRTVLVNPTYPVQRYLPTLLPGYEHGGKLERYEHGSICWDVDKESLDDVHLVLGRDDDVTDTARTPSYFHPGNSHFFGGGHAPGGEDFACVFGELVTGAADAGEGHRAVESQALSRLRRFAGDRDSCALYMYGPERRLMTADVRRLIEHVTAARPERRAVYLSADELPESPEGLRASYRDVDLVAIDNVRRSLLTEEQKRSLWTVFDEVAGHGGKVLIASDDTAVEVFGEDRDIMELVWTGTVEKCLDWSRRGDEAGLAFKAGSWHCTDRAPYMEYARHMRIDGVDMGDGHISIRWSCPGEDPDEHALYLYCADGKWLRDEEDGSSEDEGRAAMVLRKASELVIAQTEPAPHGAREFWGWGW